MWKNNAKWGRQQMIRPMLITPWIPRATNTHTQVVLILITFPLQQWLQEHASMLCYAYIACLVYICLCEVHKFSIEVNSSTEYIRDTVLLHACLFYIMI